MCLISDIGIGISGEDVCREVFLQKNKADELIFPTVKDVIS